VATVSGAIVVDSSIAFKWLSALGENRVDLAVDLLHRHLTGETILIAPASLPWEVANALRWKRRIPSSEVIELIGHLEAIQIHLMDATYSRVRSAAELAYSHGLSVYDALFLDLATEFDCPLVTADYRAFADVDTSVEIRLL
jgi:predicted nucleic acid-binding protein